MKTFKQYIQEMAFLDGDLTGMTGGEEHKSSHEIQKYKDKQGREFFVKTPNASLYEYYSDATLHILVEHLAYEIYRIFGIRVPFADLYISAGQIKLASETANGSHVNFQELPEYKDFVKGFAVDIFLANWDVAGSGAVTGNVLIDEEGNVTRIDPGGSLTFRARGGKKGESFGNDVGEIKSMTDQEKSQVAVAYNTHEELIIDSIERFVHTPWSYIKNRLVKFNHDTITSPIQDNLPDANDVLDKWEQEFSEIINKLEQRYLFMVKLNRLFNS